MALEDPGALRAFPVGGNRLLAYDPGRRTLALSLAPDRLQLFGSVKRRWDLPEKRWAHRALGDVHLFDSLVVDARRTADLTAEFPFTCPPVELPGGRLLGIVRRGREPAAMTAFDLARGETLHAHVLSDRNESFRFLRRYTNADFGFRLLDRAAYYFPPAAEANPLWDGRAQALDDGSGAPPQLASFPGFGRCSDAVADAGAVLMILDDKPVRFSREQFGALTGPVAPVISGAVSSSFACVVDGYLDEWASGAFRPVAGGSVQAVAAGGDLCLAWRIADPAFLRAFAATGPDARLRWALLPGGRAGLRPMRWDATALAGDFGRAGEDWAFDFSVSPSGEEMCLEMRLKRGRVLPGAVADLLRVPDRETRGDLAFQFEWNDEQDRPHGVFAPGGAMPVYYPRILFPFDAP
jgi:hypothetical protein